MPKVRFLPRAEKDFFALARTLQDEILHKVDLLSRFPEMGAKMERAFQGYRFLLAGKKTYRIIYKIKSNVLVEIAYIRHCRRQIRLRPIQS